MYPSVVIVVMMDDAMRGLSKMGQWPKYHVYQSLIHCAVIGGRYSAGKQLTDLTGRL